MTKCNCCNEEVEMMTGNREEYIDVKNSIMKYRICVEVRVIVCPNCGKTNVEGVW